MGRIASPEKIPGNSTLHGLREQVWPLIQDPAWLVRAITSDSGTLLNRDLQAKSQRLILPAAV